MPENLEAKAVEMIERLEGLAAQIAPEVMDAALTVTSIGAAGNLIASLALFLIACLALYVPRGWIKKGLDSLGGEVQVIYLSVALTLMFTACVIFACNWFNIWNWVALFNPELAIAHRLFG